MPLRCVDDSGASIEAPECIPERWAALKEERRIRRHLTMPCCEAQAIPKTSRLGTQFFAHKARGDCPSKPETEEHRHLKALALRAARAHGWEAQTEVGGTTPDGEKWIADMLAQRGEEQIAIEVQWSGQANEETLRRQRKYARSGVTGIWLLRQPGFPVSRDLPAACIGGSMEDGLRLLLPKHGPLTRRDRDRQAGEFHRSLSPEDFLAAVFDGRFHFGIPEGTRFKLDIEANPSVCPRCKKRMYLVMMLSGNVGPHNVGSEEPRALARNYPEMKEKIMDAIAPRTDVVTEVEYSGFYRPRIRGRCPKCGKWTRSELEVRLFGSASGNVIGTIEVEMTESLVRELGGDQHWAVWSSQSSAPLDTRQPMSSETRAALLMKRSVGRSNAGPGAEAESADRLPGAAAP